VTAQLTVGGEPVTVDGEGGGPISAFVHALRDGLGLELEVVDYTEHAVSAGTDATAAAYVELRTPDGRSHWGVGLDESILTASLKAVVSGANRLALAADDSA
jgi:2-isopropylmalate synthase